MSFVELFLIALGLSMDAFAVSICKGLSQKKLSVRHMLLAGAWFGAFQAIMPMLGFFLGSWFTSFVENYSHWAAFALLGIIGVHMIVEAVKGQEQVDNRMDPLTMLLLAVATSIDALAVGASFAFLKVRILPAALFIGCVTFVCSAAGVRVGSLFGTKYQDKAELAGGIVLVGIGLKILLEGLSVI